MSKQHQATLFVPNLHCPSCTAVIEDALDSLEPRPASVSTSIISHTISVTHSPSLSLSAICSALEEAGFEIFDVVADPPLEFGDRAHRTHEHGDQSRPSLNFEQALWRWRPLNTYNQDQKTMKHVEACELCQAKGWSEKTDEQGSRGASPDVEDRESSPVDFVATETIPNPTRKFLATVAVDGMTCSSCVGSVTRALTAIPWIVSADVSLLTHSAGVVFQGRDHADKLAAIIEEVGFDATLEAVEESVPRVENKKSNRLDLWKATYAISGMTCSSCTGTISRALGDIPWIKDADVSLITNSATVVFEDKAHTHKVLQLIEDTGYDATLDSITNLQVAEKETHKRTVSFRIFGMYCNHCPSRVTSAVQNIRPGEIEITKAPTVADSILTVRYIPQQPFLTIRQIQQAIRQADEVFEARIHHPLSLEERSRMMQAREQRHILYRLLLSIAAAIPSFIIGIILMSLVPANNPSKQYLSERVGGISRIEWAMFITATPVYFFATDIFHRRTIKELRALWRPRSPTPILQRFYRFGSMNMLISFGTSIAYFSSIAEMAIVAKNNVSMSHKHDTTGNTTYFDSVVFLTMFLLVGRLLEAHTKSKSGDAVAELGKLRPSTALLVRGGQETSEGEQINVDQLEIGDHIRVLNGSSPPYDGVVIRGLSEFDESALTGESKLVAKTVGDEVFSGTINKGSPISIRINGVEGQSMLDQIMKVVREGQARRAPVERIADILTGYFVPVITLLAIMTWITWMALGLSGALPQDYLDISSGGWPFWSLEFAIAVFVVACPCGIGLAAPTALFVGGGLAAKHGILVKGGGEAFQEASNLDCVVFDKTGTLTMGTEPTIANYEAYIDDTTTMNEQEILGIVRTIESASTHPIAKALVRFCTTHNAGSVDLETEEIAGKGMKGYSAKKDQTIQEALVGNESLLSDYRVAVSATAAETIESWKQEGKSIALLAINHSSNSSNWILAAAFAISDTLRPEAKGVINELQKRDLDVWMISGDNHTTAQAVGTQVGIPHNRIIAGVLPSEKAEHVKKLQLSQSRTKSNTGRAVVAMVGDGINDSPALATADVGIAIGSGSDVAISSAEFVLVSSNLVAILMLTDLSRAVFRRIKVNFMWALIYNLCAVPIAAGVLYPLTTNGGKTHIRLDPAWAALAMALSSVSVVCSSLLLRSRLPLVGFREVAQESTRT